MRNTRDLIVTDDEVWDFCKKNLPPGFDVNMMFNILSGKINATDDHFLYTYFIFNWHFLFSIYMRDDYNNFKSFRYTQDLADSNNLIFDEKLLVSSPQIFFYYIVMAVQEALLLKPDVTVYNSSIKLRSYVAKLKDMMGRVDVILSDKGQDLSFSLIPYLLTTYFERSNFKQLNEDASKLEGRLKNIKEDEGWSSIQSFLTDAEELQGKINTQNTLLSQIDEYNNKLNNLKSDYNFISLSKAFVNMKRLKSKELNSLNIIFYSVMALLLIVPTSLFLFNVFGHPEKFAGWNKLFYFLPVATIELILLYLLRLFYIQRNSVLAQLLQIDFRLSICEFIKNYIDDKSLDKDGQETWALFETLIFSPIQPREDKIPSVLDGVDSISDLINKILKAKVNSV